MTEVLFILTTIFVAYIVYTVIDEQKTSIKAKASEVKQEAATEQPQVLVEQIKPVAIKTVTAKAPATQVVTPKVATTAKPAKKATIAKKTGLKDPKTGDISTSYSNYRFTKRWIKDALVTEGLLEKVYTNNELNAEAEVKIKAAIRQLETLEKYKP